MQMSKLFLLGFCALYAVAGCAQDGAAAEPFSGYVQFMTNYVGRGLTQSVGQSSAQGEFDYYAADGIYTNLDGTSINWIDQAYPGDSVSIEVDGVIGYRHMFAQDWTYKFGVLRLQFPGRYVPQSPPAAEPNTTEVFGYLSWRGLSARLNYSVTDSFGTPDSKGSTYLDLSASQPLDERWILGGHLGLKRQTGKDPLSGVSHSRSNYTDYKLSMAYAFRSDLSVTMAETWTNANPALYTINGYDAGGHHLWLVLEKDY
jgi:uncharacterized protein (TIGR02001 family)